MDRYNPSTPGVAFAFAAVALTAVTLALAVILPAGTNAAESAATVLASTRIVTPAEAQVAVAPARIERIEVVYRPIRNAVRRCAPSIGECDGRPL
jgi:hypothetical protein